MLLASRNDILDGCDSIVHDTIDECANWMYANQLRLDLANAIVFFRFSDGRDMLFGVHIPRIDIDNDIVKELCSI